MKASKLSLTLLLESIFPGSPCNGIRHLLLIIFDATNFTINGKNKLRNYRIVFLCEVFGIINNSIFAGLLIRNVHFLIHSLTKKGFLKFSLAEFFESSFQKNASKPRQLASKDTLVESSSHFSLTAHRFRNCLFIMFQNGFPLSINW